MEFQKTTVFALHVFILSAAITLNTAAARGQTRTDRTYHCTAKDAISLQGNGTIGKNDPAADARRKHFESMTVDVLSGAISYGGAGIRERRVVQELDADDHILIPRTSFIQRKKSAAIAATDFIRVRSSPQVTFVAFSLAAVVTGTCEPAR